MRPEGKSSFWELLWAAGKLGLLSFGGPIAHLGYFREEYVNKRRWISEERYASLVALCQFLPGPASSQVGIGIGLLRGGIAGGIASFLGFTLPSVFLLALFALAISSGADWPWLHGLKLVAVAVVAQAVLGMGKKLAPDLPRRSLVALAAVVALLAPSAWTQVLAIAGGGAAGYALYRRTPAHPLEAGAPFVVSKRTGAVCLALFAALLVSLPAIAAAYPAPAVQLFDRFYRAGALVFGGGHVVLPLLEQSFVPSGWLSEEQFLAGYAAAQAVPGPLFTFASYIGAVIGGWRIALLATLAIFLPAFLLVAGALPFWSALQGRAGVRAAVTGMNAAVVGLLLAALYNPIWVSAIQAPKDFAAALLLFFMLEFAKAPPWLAVAIGGLLGFVLPALP